MSVVQTERPALLYDATRAVPALRLLPAPVAEPPYDRAAREHAAREHAARARAARVHRAVEPLRLAPAPLRLVPPLPGEDDEWSRPRTPLSGLAPVQPFAQAFVQRLVEVLAGVRPLLQLQRDTTPELYARLEGYVVRRPRPLGARPDRRAVRSVHVQPRPEGVAEGCATLKQLTPQGPRATALAFRLEGLDGRWCCTELQGL